MDTRASLLLRLKDPRDSAAWTEFDAIYRPMLYRYAKSQGLSDADAEDEVQRCMAAIQQIMGDFSYDPQKGRFKSWLRTMINNRCRNARRDRMAHHNRIQAAHHNRDIRQESPEETVDRIWMEEHLKHGLRSLRSEIDEVKFRAFEEYVVKERPVKDVCEALGLTPPQLYKIKWQVTHKLREHISSLLKGRGTCLSRYELQRYHAGELRAAEAEHVKAHLSACASCSERNSKLLANHDRLCNMLRSLDLES